MFVFSAKAVATYVSYPLILCMLNVTLGVWHGVQAFGFSQGRFSIWGACLALDEPFPEHQSLSHAPYESTRNQDNKQVSSRTRNSRDAVCSLSAIHFAACVAKIMLQNKSANPDVGQPCALDLCRDSVRFAFRDKNSETLARFSLICGDPLGYEDFTRSSPSLPPSLPNSNTHQLTFIVSCRASDRNL